MWAAPAFMYAGLELYKGNKASSKGKRQARRKSRKGESSNSAIAVLVFKVCTLDQPYSHHPPHTHTHNSCQVMHVV